MRKPSTDCPYGDDHCPVVTGPPMKHGMDCQYCKTMLSDDDTKRLSPEQQRYLKTKRKVSPMRGGSALTVKE